MIAPYYDDQAAGITVYHGNAAAIVREIAAVDVIIADPCYGETALSWDKWLDEWPAMMPARSLWCFGTLRMFMMHAAEFAAGAWKLSQDVIWEKHNGSGLFNDRFRKVHEQAAHFYRGKWDAVYKAPQFTNDATARTIRRKIKPNHWSKIGDSSFQSIDGGPRMMRSVIRARSEHGRALNPTQKPINIMVPLLLYSCPPAGTVLDPFCGSGSTLVAAQKLGMRAIGIEARESECENTVHRLKQAVLPLEDSYS